MIKCKCGKETVTGRCKSCSNRARKGKYKPHRPKGIVMNWKNKLFEEKNPMWKSDRVKYGALHQWIKRRKPQPELCEECNLRKPYDLANISGEYKRDVKDYKWLCRKCHTTMDYKNGIRKPNRKRETKNGLFRCGCCKKFKSKEEFYEAQNREDKVSGRCRECSVIGTRQSRAKKAKEKLNIKTTGVI